MKFSHIFKLFTALLYLFFSLIGFSADDFPKPDSMGWQEADRILPYDRQYDFAKEKSAPPVGIAHKKAKRPRMRSNFDIFHNQTENQNMEQVTDIWKASFRQGVKLGAGGFGSVSELDELAFFNPEDQESKFEPLDLMVDHVLKVVDFSEKALLREEAQQAQRAGEDLAIQLKLAWADTEKAYAVMEKTAGTLDHFLIEDAPNLNEIENAFFQLLRTVYRVYASELRHGDIKASNIHFHNGVWKLADFYRNGDTFGQQNYTHYKLSEGRRDYYALAVTFIINLHHRFQIPIYNGFDAKEAFKVVSEHFDLNGNFYKFIMNCIDIDMSDEEFQVELESFLN